MENFPKSLLILDQFRVNMTPLVINKFKDLNTDILFIPPGLTSKIQPLDVFINKPLKDRLRNRWEEYILNSEPNNKGKLIS